MSPLLVTSTPGQSRHGSFSNEGYCTPPRSPEVKNEKVKNVLIITKLVYIFW